MSTEVEEHPSETGRLVSLLKQLIREEPSESQLTELGQSLFSVVKASLSGNDQSDGSSRPTVNEPG